MRIYTNAEYEKMDQDELPEIMRCNVIEAVLKMKARGVDDVLTFSLMDAPDVMYMEKALNHLYAMDALDQDGALTKVGKQMAKFPLPATHGRVLIAAADPSADCLLEVIDILACLNTDNEIFLQPKSEEENETMNENRSDIYRREGDLITLLTTMQRYAAENTNRNDWCHKHLVSVRAMKLAYTIRKQLRQLSLNEKLLTELPPADPQPFEPITPDKATIVMKTFLKAFIKETAILGPDGSYKTTAGRETIHIHPSSVLYGKKLEAIMFLQHVFTTKNYAKKVSAVQADWIVEQYGL
jgi:ATP-dependent RNA helicase DHR2